MTVRKLQKTGGASLSIIIPKKWAAQLNLTDKSELIVDASHPKILKLFPNDQLVQVTNIKISAEDQNINKIVREVIAAYLAGAEQVTVENLSPKFGQLTKLHRLCSSLIGFEVIEKSATKLVLQNVFDADKFPLSKNLEKMFVMVQSMFADTLAAFGEQNPDLAQNVIQREEEIDKFHLAITRQFYVHLRNETKLSGNLSALDLYYIGLISRQLERIADHCVKICLLIEKHPAINQKRSNLPSQKLISLAKYIEGEIERAATMTKNIDKKTAHSILDECQTLTKKINRYQLDTKTTASQLLIACDSFDRICGYLTNMAEATLDQSLI